MGDRGNIAVIQDEAGKEQVWFYGHWSGWRMPAALQHAIREGKGRWQDPSYFARIVFCRLVTRENLHETASFGISTSIGDNEYPIMVADCSRQIVFQINEKDLDNGRVPLRYETRLSWTFEEYAALDKLPFGATIEQHIAEIEPLPAQPTP